MRALVGFGVLLVWFSAAVAEEPPAVSPQSVGEPMRIVPTVIGQPMNPRPAADQQVTEVTNPPQLQLLIAPPVAAAPEPLSVQVAGANP